MTPSGPHPDDWRAKAARLRRLADKSNCPECRRAYREAADEAEAKARTGADS